MFSTLLKITGSALGLWQSKESRKYQDRLVKLEHKYYEEDNKERPDMAVLDNLEFDLRVLSNAISAEIGKQNFKT